MFDKEIVINPVSMIGFRMIMAYHCTTVKTSVELPDGVDMFGMLLGSVQYPTSSHIAGFSLAPYKQSWSDYLLQLGNPRFAHHHVVQ